ASSAPSFTVLSEIPGVPASHNMDGTNIPGLPTDYTLTKTVASSFTPGGQLTYTITVTNHGPGVSSGWTVTDPIPAGLTGVSSPTPGCKVTAGSVVCTGGQLEVGHSATITILATTAATQLACITNSATVQGNEADSVTGNNAQAATSCPVLPSF